MNMKYDKIEERKRKFEQIKEYVKTMPVEQKQRLIEQIREDWHLKPRDEYIIEIKQILKDIHDEPKKERCHYLYDINRQSGISNTVLCYAFQISEGLYRRERIIHRDEWEAAFQKLPNSYLEDYFIEANLDHEWNHKIPIAPFILPELT